MGRWCKNLTDDEPDFSSNPNDEENFGGSFDGDLINEDTSDHSRDTAGGIAESPVPRRTSRRRKRAIPSFPRELNLRKRTRKNYNVGSPSRKRRNPKLVI